MEQTFRPNQGRVRQLTADEATVLVWKNDRASSLTSGGRFGHASIMLRTDQIPETARFDLEKEQSKVDRLMSAASDLTDEIDEMKKKLTLATGQLASGGGGAFAKQKGKEIDALKAELARKDKEWELLWDREVELRKEIKFWDNPNVVRWYYLVEAEEGSFKHVHISWWPSKGVGGDLKEMRRAIPGKSHSVWDDLISEISSRTRRRLEAGELQPRQGQVNLGKAYGLLDEDGESWGQEPDWVISVPAFGAANRYWGVNVARMWTWFTHYRDLSVGADYKMISTSKSCAGLAMRALRQGGAEAFTKQPVSHFYVLPNEVAKYAMHVRASIVEMNAQSMRFEFNVLQPWISRRMAANPFAQPHKKADLWTADQWRANRQPHARGAFAMGDHLEEYHSTDPAKDWAKKFRALGTIFSSAVEEIEDEPSTKNPTPRVEALIIVCAQCLNVIRNPQSWVSRN